MKEKLINISKIVIGILSIILPLFIIAYILDNFIKIYEYEQLKWIVLLVCVLGFYISGLINRKTPLKFIPFLYISLLIFIPMRNFYFPLIYFLILFATISLLLTRKEFSKKIKLASFTLMSGLFVYFLFSQPLIIRKGDSIKINQYGDLINGKTIWDFTEKRDNLLPESIFLDSEFNPFDLKSLKNKTLYISFWATWCGPCRAEKPQLKKLKSHFKNDSNIVFVDISVDERKKNWKKYIESKKPSGIQLISKDYAKTRSLFELSGIPAHLLVNTKGEFAKARIIEQAYSLLSDSINLNRYIHRKPLLFNIENFMKSDSTKTIYYTTNDEDRLSATQLNNHINNIIKELKTENINISTEKFQTQNNDSIIYKVYINKMY